MCVYNCYLNPSLYLYFSALCVCTEVSSVGHQEFGLDVINFFSLEFLAARVLGTSCKKPLVFYAQNQNRI